METVLGIRNRAREEAARHVALRLQQLQSAEDELARRQRRLQTCYEQQNTAQIAVDDKLRGGIQAHSLIAHQNFLNDLRQIEVELKADVEKQILAVTRAEKELEAARDKLIEAARDLKSIEVHKANWQETEQKVETRRDQKISDEIGAILHGRRESS